MITMLTSSCTKVVCGVQGCGARIVFVKRKEGFPESKQKGRRKGLTHTEAPTGARRLADDGVGFVRV